VDGVLGVTSPGETVTVVRPGSTTDRYGNPTADWTAATSTEVDGAAVAPRLQPEQTDEGRQAAVDALTAYLPPGTDVVHTDRVVVRGLTYEVDGRPAVWTSPFTATTRGIEVPLRRVAG
jgi:hypothetical protein